MNDPCAWPLPLLLNRHPAVSEFLRSLGLDPGTERRSTRLWLDGLSDEEILDAGMGREEILSRIEHLVTEEGTRRQRQTRTVERVSILGGRDKSGHGEEARIEAHAGEIICVVGPTGSGKSRLLADIECLAQGDTPTGRQVLLDGLPACEEERFSLDRKPVAQLSQNMNFVMDLPAGEFIEMHARCRMVEDAHARAGYVIACANRLTGEKFPAETPLTQLSGGQARALMIADTALLSAAPVVLIDEIENAGVDRGRALDLLVTGKKIVFISTHDPLLALRGHRRVVVRHGGIAAVIEAREAERRNLAFIEAVDATLARIRDRLRRGDTIEEDIAWPPKILRDSVCCSNGARNPG